MNEWAASQLKFFVFTIELGMMHCKKNTEQFYLPLRNGYPIHDDHVELQLSLTKLLHNIVYMRGYLTSREIVIQSERLIWNRLLQCGIMAWIENGVERDRGSFSFPFPYLLDKAMMTMTRVPWDFFISQVF